MKPNLTASLRSLMALTGASTLALCVVATPAAARPALISDDIAIADWSEKVWATARSCGGCDALEVLTSFPEGVLNANLDGLRASIDRYNENLAKRESDRAERIAEVQDELQQQVIAGDLSKALKAAIELFTLEPDRNTVLGRADVRELVHQAEEKARRLEAEGEWLESHSLFNRLHFLYEEDRRYRADLDRLSQRLLMVRLYTPERLHEMRSRQLVEQGEDPLPPYNALGDKWADKLFGINQRMVLAAVWQASTRHLDKDRIGMDRLLIGGLGSLRTMVTTSDLAEAFPGLADESARRAFTDFLDAVERTIAEKGRFVGQQDLFITVRDVMRRNDETVRIASEALLHEFGNGAMSQLDEFSAVIWPDELEQFKRTTDGAFKGVGIQITLDDAQQLKVVTPLEGTPAARAGIRPGDLIRKIDGEPTIGIILSQAVDRITGEQGTAVTLTVEREGHEGLIDYQLVRAEIPIYSVKGWRRTGARETDWDWFIDPEHKIGYVRLTQFTRDTSRELLDAVTQMRRTGLDGLILDLRYNPGGLLSEAVEVASLFVDRGVVVTQENAEGQPVETQIARRGRAVLADLPVVCLVNGGSASASEIVAGCLQDHKKAVVVGERSFGKGSVQNVFTLAQNAAFKLTTQYYRLPLGRKIHRTHESKEWGIAPDIQVEMLPSQMGEALMLRQSADIIEFDEQGRVPEGFEAPDPSRLLAEGIDPQLETALLLVQSQVVVTPEQRKRAALN